MKSEEQTKIKLEIYAISYSQAQTGAYALILGEPSGKKRLPIVIGAFEAQSIAIAIEKMKSTRPLTHDLFLNFAVQFGINIKEVIIDRFSEGIFFSKLICEKNGEDQVYEIDSRTSDAVALAVRFQCPIYTYKFIMDAAGMVIDDDDKNKNKISPEMDIPVKSKKEIKDNGEYKDFNIGELNKMLETAVNDEDYEKASIIRDEINRRKKKK